MQIAAYNELRLHHTDINKDVLLSSVAAVIIKVAT
jgi:hypothetical protein